MGEFEGMDWGELKQAGCHRVAVNHLHKDAIKRLQAIKQDDVEELYSFRFSGAERMWGIQDGRVIRLLWWDPLHQVCPSLKK
jgi:hypothetical protein